MSLDYKNDLMIESHVDKESLLNLYLTSTVKLLWVASGFYTFVIEKVLVPPIELMVMTALVPEI